MAENTDWIALEIIADVSNSYPLRIEILEGNKYFFKVLYIFAKSL